ncbi:MAG: DNA-formamidopyrimidine glycosylase [Candidatus Cloacimonetes bacterium]|nr:DNA-formamidopyrimidine glycosylase [Candidatus Cloacimonadota bacterium]
MPELPEVETIKRELEAMIIGKTIKKTEALLDRAFINKDGFDTNGQIEKISRVGKYLLIDIADKCTLVIHLRMTGKLIYETKNTTQDSKHNRVIFYFKTGDRLVFNDIRTFGLVEVLPYQTPLQSIKDIGIDALSDDFTFALFDEICRKKAVPIKNLLLDQKLIAGIGNIYAQEILFWAKISPERVASKLYTKERKRIYEQINRILLKAIKHNGTSISDYRRIDNKTGEFQNFLQVYAKKVCPVCKNTLTKIKQGGRTTTFCSSCQK